jgi:hypothetical protein
MLLAVAYLPKTATAVNPDPITAAWEKARAAGSYQFDSNVQQITIPAATVMNVGRSSRSQQLHLSGESNLRQNRLEMQLWASGGSICTGRG